MADLMREGTIWRASHSEYYWIVIKKQPYGIVASVVNIVSGHIFESFTHFSWAWLVEQDAMIVQDSFHPCPDNCGRCFCQRDGTPVMDRVYKLDIKGGYNVDLMCEGHVIKSWWIGVFENRKPLITDPKVRAAIAMNEDFLKLRAATCNPSEKE